MARRVFFTPNCDNTKTIFYFRFNDSKLDTALSKQNQRYRAVIESVGQGDHGFLFTASATADG